MKKNNENIGLADVLSYVNTNFTSLIDYENFINWKIKNNKELSNKEYIFKNFIISPTFMTAYMIRILKKGLENDRTRRKTK